MSLDMAVFKFPRVKLSNPARGEGGRDSPGWYHRVQICMKPLELKPSPACVFPTALLEKT